MAKRSNSWIQTINSWLPGWPKKHHRQADPEIQIRGPNDDEMSSNSAPARLDADLRHPPRVRDGNNSVPPMRNNRESSKTDNSDDDEYYRFESDAQVRGQRTNKNPNGPNHSTPNTNQFGRNNANHDRGDNANLPDHNYCRSQPKTQRQPKTGYQYDSSDSEREVGPFPYRDKFYPNYYPS